MKKFFKILLILIIIVIAYKSFNYFTSEERRLKVIINQGESAIERKNLEECMKYISQNYSDDYSQNYQSLKENIQKIFEEYEEIHIWIRKREIILRDNSAEVNLGIIVSASSEKLGSVRGQEKFTLYFRKENNDWRIIKAPYLPAN